MLRNEDTGSMLKMGPLLEKVHRTGGRSMFFTWKMTLLVNAACSYSPQSSQNRKP